jgi:hypothetical protein
MIISALEISTNLKKEYVFKFSTEQIIINFFIIFWHGFITIFFLKKSNHYLMAFFLIFIYLNLLTYLYWNFFYFPLNAKPSSDNTVNWLKSLSLTQNQQYNKLKTQVQMESNENMFSQILHTKFNKETASENNLFNENFFSLKDYKKYNITQEISNLKIKYDEQFKNVKEIDDKIWKEILLQNTVNFNLDFLSTEVQNIFKSYFCCNVQHLKTLYNNLILDKNKNTTTKNLDNIILENIYYENNFIKSNYTYFNYSFTLISNANKILYLKYNNIEIFYLDDTSVILEESKPIYLILNDGFFTFKDKENTLDKYYNNNSIFLDNLCIGFNFCFLRLFKNFYINCYEKKVFIN